MLGHLMIKIKYKRTKDLRDQKSIKIEVDQLIYFDPVWRTEKIKAWLILLDLINLLRSLCNQFFCQNTNRVQDMSIIL